MTIPTEPIGSIPRPVELIEAIARAGDHAGELKVDGAGRIRFDNARKDLRRGERGRRVLFGLRALGDKLDAADAHHATDAGTD